MYIMPFESYKAKLKDKSADAKTGLTVVLLKIKGIVSFFRHKARILSRESRQYATYSRETYKKTNNQKDRIW